MVIDEYHLVDTTKPLRPSFRKNKLQKRNFRNDFRRDRNKNYKGDQQRRNLRNERREALRDPESLVLGTVLKVTTEWKQVQQFDFSGLNRMMYQEPEGEDIELNGSPMWFGVLAPFDRSVERITARSARRLEKFVDRSFYYTTTFEDPIIRDLSQQGIGDVFITDTILSAIMTGSRSLYPWDVAIHKIGTKIFFDKRDEASLDFLTVHENAQELPARDGSAPNTPHNLSLEATMINQNFSQQVLEAEEEKFETFGENPFYDPGEEPSMKPATICYRYRQWRVGDYTLVCRCEINAVTEVKGERQYVVVKALNEWDSKSGNQWKKKLESLSGSILAEEIRYNGNKLARWTASSILAGANILKLGFVTRANMKEAHSHSILGIKSFNPTEFANQINLSMINAWGVVKMLIDMCMRMEDGKYILLKVAEESMLRLYKVPDYYEDDAEEEENKEDVVGFE